MRHPTSTGLAPFAIGHRHFAEIDERSGATDQTFMLTARSLEERSGRTPASVMLDAEPDMATAPRFNQLANPRRACSCTVPIHAFQCYPLPSLIDVC